jgi:N-acetylglucosamine-6-phosphate deacetylase
MSSHEKSPHRGVEEYGKHFLGPRPTDNIVRLITLAPELKGMMRATEELSQAGFIVSIGHSSATTVQAVEAVRRGATMITHLFNAMPQLRE